MHNILIASAFSITYAAWMNVSSTCSLQLQRRSAMPSKNRMNTIQEIEYRWCQLNRLDRPIIKRRMPGPAHVGCGLAVIWEVTVEGPDVDRIESTVNRTSKAWSVDFLYRNSLLPLPLHIVTLVLCGLRHVRWSPGSHVFTTTRRSVTRSTAADTTDAGARRESDCRRHVDDDVIRTVTAVNSRSSDRLTWWAWLSNCLLHNCPTELRLQVWSQAWPICRVYK